MNHTFAKVMTDERIIAYLLEELPEEELEQFEDECFAQENWPTQLSLVEEDLIDAYLRGELKQEQHQHFERNYLTTEPRQQRVIMAAALLRHFDECQAPAQATVIAQPIEHTRTERLRAFWKSQTWAVRAAAAVAIVAIIAVALWLSIPRTRSPRTFATLNLTISSDTRGEGAQAAKVKLPLKADALKIILKKPEQLPPEESARVALDYYNAELKKFNLETKSLEISEQDAQSISVVLPAEQLVRGEYVLKLFTVKADGAEQRIPDGYFFVVE